MFSDAFHSNFTASTSKHSVLFSGLLKTAFEGFCGVGGGSTGPPPLPSPPSDSPPPHEIKNRLKIYTVDNNTFFITL